MFLQTTHCEIGGAQSGVTEELRLPECDVLSTGKLVNCYGLLEGNGIFRESVTL